MKRCNFKTFDSMRKYFRSVINNKEVHLKEEKALLLGLPSLLISGHNLNWKGV